MLLTIRFRFSDVGLDGKDSNREQGDRKRVDQRAAVHHLRRVSRHRHDECMREPSHLRLPGELLKHIRVRTTSSSRTTGTSQTFNQKGELNSKLLLNELIIDFLNVGPFRASFYLVSSFLYFY